MMFKRLEVENFGPFRGKHCLSLEVNRTPSDHKPIVIIGGKNGTGKTTLFEAIKICLYGRFFRGRRLSDKAYKKYISRKFHRYPNGKLARYASVAVEFDYARLGEITNYFVKRSWKRVSSHIIEELKIEQNGKLLDDLDEDQWQEFLMELIPLGISKFFFFDGEQIQRLAKKKNENEYILSSINSLLGLDVVERLQSDIKIYASRKTKTINNQIELKIQECKKMKEVLESELETILDRKRSLKKRINQIKIAIESQEIKIAMEGGSFASKRESLKNQKKKIDEEIEHTREKIRDLCSTLLPFAYVPDLCYKLKKRLEQEEKEEQKLAAVRFLNMALDEIAQDLELSPLWDSLKIPLNERSRILKIFLGELKRKIEFTNDHCKEIIHPLSSIERSEILKWIELALNDVPAQLVKLTTRLEKLTRERQKIEKFLFSVPSDEAISPLIRRLGELYEKLGKYQEKLSSLEEKERQIKNKLNQVTRELEKSLKEKARIENVYERLSLLKKVQDALDEYLVSLRKKKLSEFRENFFRCFNFLFNKKYFVSKVEINPSTFNINLVNSNGTIPINTLSAGERQIYAISLCWALARTSGRPIPFIIDTPLGRLDKEHRQRVVKRFFPNASHQIIIFSTDTEIDAATFLALKKYVSKTYCLEYNEAEGTTYIKNGYFTNEEALVHELQQSKNK